MAPTLFWKSVSLGHPVCLKQLAWSQLEIRHGFEPQPRRRVQVFLPPGVIAPLMGARQLLVGLLVPYHRPGAVTPIALPNLCNGHSAFSNRWYQHFLTKTLMIVLQPNCVCWIGLNQVQVDKIDCHCIERGECTQTYSAYFPNGWQYYFRWIQTDLLQMIYQRGFLVWHQQWLAGFILSRWGVW